MEEQSIIAILPKEICIHITQLVQDEDLRSLACTNRFFNAILCNDYRIWRFLLHKEFGFHEKAQDPISYKEITQIYRIQGKPKLLIPLLGHVDAGKSTLLGHLYWKSGCVLPKIKREVEELELRLGRPGSKYSFLLGLIANERKPSRIDNDVTFQIEKRELHFFDSAGMRDWVSFALTKLPSANCPILVIGAPMGEFEAAYSRDGLARVALYLLQQLDFKKFIILINKMDYKGVAYSKGRYDEIRDEITMRFPMTKNVLFIPTSGWVGDNIYSKSDNMPWYTGPTLHEALSEFPLEIPDLQKPFRFLPSDVKQKDSFLKVNGSIISGMVRTNQKVSLLLNDKQLTVNEITKDGESISVAVARQEVFMSLTCVDEQVKEIFPALMVDPYVKPPELSKRAIARIMFLTSGMSFPCSRLLTMAYLTKSFSISLISVFDVKGNPVPDKTLHSYYSAVVKLEAEEPIPFFLFEDCRELGSIILRDMFRVAFVGKIIQINANA